MSKPSWCSIEGEDKCGIGRRAAAVADVTAFSSTWKISRVHGPRRHESTKKTTHSSSCLRAFVAKRSTDYPNIAESSDGPRNDFSEAQQALVRGPE
jgi:hypothetical protein